MSRIGNNPIGVPDGVTVDLNENSITVKGKMGELSQEYFGVSIMLENNEIIIKSEKIAKIIPDNILKVLSVFLLGLINS